MIHPTAIIDPAARLASDVEVGPYSIIGAGVEIGPGSWVGPHVVIRGPTRIGANNRIFQFSSIGEIPQDKKFAGEDSPLEIGDGNTIREYVTINRGTEEGGGITRVGNDNWIMAYCHIAHDCIVGDHTIFANNATLAGHVTVEDYAILGGFTGVHQFCRIGAHSFAGMFSAITKDVPPYVMVVGNTAKPGGINSEGLRRRGFTAEQVQNVKRAYKVIYKSGMRLEEAREELRNRAAEQEELKILVEFLDAGNPRGIVR